MLIQRVKTKLNISSRRKSMTLLDGAYESKLKGKSLDFDDLREYTPGDDVRDIDWRATARHTTPLVKRYVANRRHNIVLALDTSVTMTATAPSYEPKSELALMTAGLLGYIAVKNHDSVSVVTQTQRFPSQGGERNLNQALTRVETEYEHATAAQSLTQLLENAYRHAGTHSIILVLTDHATPNESLKKQLRLLNRKHDVLWVNVTDINPADVDVAYAVYDVLDFIHIPEEIRADLELVESINTEDAHNLEQFTSFLESERISNMTVSRTEDIIPHTLTMLQRRQHEHRLV